MDRYIKGFETMLSGINFETIENSAHSIYGLSKKLELIYFNEAWLAFAKANGAGSEILEKFPIGTPFRQAISGDLKKFYLKKYREVLRTCKVWNNEYECSSPSTYRVFHQRVYPLKHGEGLIIVNNIKIEKKLRTDGSIASPQREQYIQKSGFLTQCSNCRCTQRANESKIWDWIPSWVEELPEKVSHSICPVCFDFYWKASDRLDIR